MIEIAIRTKLDSEILNHFDIHGEKDNTGIFFINKSKLHFFNFRTD